MFSACVLRWTNELAHVRGLAIATFTALAACGQAEERCGSSTCFTHATLEFPGRPVHLTPVVKDDGDGGLILARAFDTPSECFAHVLDLDLDWSNDHAAIEDGALVVRATWPARDLASPETGSVSGSRGSWWVSSLDLTLAMDGTLEGSVGLTAAFATDGGEPAAESLHALHGQYATSCPPDDESLPLGTADGGSGSIPCRTLRTRPPTEPCDDTLGCGGCSAHDAGSAGAAILGAALVIAWRRSRASAIAA
jgi:hypothetical protein